MALVNCPECGHPMSDEAKVCPNCFKPRKVGTKQCKNCGYEMDSKKRKCPKCGSDQFKSSKTEKPTEAMATKKSNSSTFDLKSLIVGLLIGASILYFTLPYLQQQKSSDKHSANVERVNGLYVYIESTPQDEYRTLGTFQGNNMIDIWKSFSIGKDRAGDVLLNMILAGQDNLVFYKKLLQMTQKIRIEYPTAQGIIFGDQMNTCQVIKFK